MNTYLIEEMTWPEIKAALEAGVDTIIIYAASIEQHGPQLAELTDTQLGYQGGIDLAKRLGNALVAPVIRLGLSNHHLSLPGSLTLRPEVFRGVVEDYVACYVTHGFKKIILTSSHGGNFQAIADIAKTEAAKYPDVCIVSGLSLAELTPALEELERIEGLEPGVCGGHACDWETSVMLHFTPQHVRMDQAERGFVGTPTPEVLERFFTEGVVAVSEIGVMGDPSHADGERGGRYFKYLQDIQERVVRAHIAEWEQAHQ